MEMLLLILLGKRASNDHTIFYAVIHDSSRHHQTTCVQQAGESRDLTNLISAQASGSHNT